MCIHIYIYMAGCQNYVLRVTARSFRTGGFARGCAVYMYIYIYMCGFAAEGTPGAAPPQMLRIAHEVSSWVSSRTASLLVVPASLSPGLLVQVPLCPRMPVSVSSSLCCPCPCLRQPSKVARGGPRPLGPLLRVRHGYADRCASRGSRGRFGKLFCLGRVQREGQRGVRQGARCIYIYIYIQIYKIYIYRREREFDKCFSLSREKLSAC